MKFIKRSLLMMLLICLICASSLLNTDAAAASGKCGDNITWTVENNILTLTGSGEMYDFDAANHSCLPYSACDLNSIHTVKISEGITRIGKYAFFSFKSLKYVEMPDVTTIGHSAFFDCKALTQISGDNVTILEDSAFQNCSRLASVSFPKVETIGEQAFINCSALTSIQMPNTGTIGVRAFTRCTAITAINFPNVKEIDNYAFQECSALRSVTLPQVSRIGECAFQNCGALSSLNIPQITSIDHYAFNFCARLTTLSLPQLQTLGAGAFESCTALTEVNLPLLKEIPGSAFYGCSALHTVNIPRATSVGYSAFNRTALREVSFPNALTIGDSAFYQCRALEAVNIPSAKHIQFHAFCQCSAVEFYILSTDLTHVDEAAFTENHSLTTVYMYAKSDTWAPYFDTRLNSDFLNATLVAVDPTPVLNELPAVLAVAKGTAANLTATILGIAQSYTWQVCLPGSTEWTNISPEQCATANENDLHYGSMRPEDEGTKLRCLVETLSGEILTTTEVTLTYTPFSDVSATGFYYPAMVWALDKGITTGTSDTAFSPNNPCTRGQVVTFLWRAAGSPEPVSTENPFSDVKEGPFYKAILWAVEQGITTGYSDGTFRPAASCTRGQIATFLWRAAGSPEPTSTHNPFSDVSDGPFYKAILWAVEQGITTGYTDGTFRPSASCTRAHIVTFLYRSYN